VTGPAPGATEAAGTLGASRYATVNGVRLHYVEAGRGPLVVLLHGFPQFWYAWRHQLPALAAAGFRAVAVDLRGYNLSDKPAGLDAYTAAEAAADVAALVEALGAEPAALVGHDWGGVVAWQAAAAYPERVSRVAVINAPHPRRFARALRSPRQLLRSLYVLFFQLPVLPERLVAARDFALVERVLRFDARRGSFTRDDVARHKEALRRPGALTAALGYYRAALRRRAARRLPAGVRQPALLIWGDRDRYLGRELAAGNERWVPRLRVEHVPEATHWVMADAPERVNELLVAFLREPA